MTLVSHAGPGTVLVIDYPQSNRPLPTPATLAHVQGCALVQVVVAGRSGSSLVHAYLDGHPEVVHIPHTFKYFDFAAANPDLLSLSPAGIVARFSESPLTPFLFDSTKSVIIGGRLGERMDVYVRVSRDEFRRAFESLMANEPPTHRTIFLGLVTAFGWCLGQDPMCAKVVLHHLHHGDWLYPQLLLDHSNCAAADPTDGEAMLVPNKIIQTIRDPLDTFRSSSAFARKHDLPEAQAVETQELLVRLFAQDWLRAQVIRRRGPNRSYVIRIEDLRRDPLSAIRECAVWLGISPDAPTLVHLTYFGWPWMGDIYTEPRSTIRRESGVSQVNWQDRAYLAATLGQWATAAGYNLRGGAAAWGLLALSLIIPSATVFAPATGWFAKWVAASKVTASRLRFAWQLRSLARQQLAGTGNES